ncbi:MULTISPECIES: response regulator transcription factor [Streptosporangium]|uniref:DNA-binding NarL/FixJ family response regulator n=1 Tax=Streptosporangium brasiliense TaxID=47480 RepID=A0ABT9RLM7_9ACTN|nr:response regulator transcription factor [Streptosporangium brasiliense]MDP9870197.1 DNA-binding NarL/FixJ family response regulator [Streptosporangium brasiliense]
MTSLRHLSDQADLPGRVVLVAMGNEVIRCGLCTMLDDLSMVDETCATDDFDHGVELLRSRRPDILVLPTPGEQHVAEKLARTAVEHDVRILLLLRAASDGALVEAAALPADGFLLENDLTRDSLGSALADLDSGLMPMPGPLARKLLARVRRAEAAREREAERHPGADRAASPLTSRERETLSLMAEGLSNKQIARRLGISEHGAKRHVANILAKLNCSNRTLATAVALNRGLLPDLERGPRD